MLDTVTLPWLLLELWFLVVHCLCGSPPTQRYDFESTTGAKKTQCFAVLQQAISRLHVRVGSMLVGWNTVSKQNNNNNNGVHQGRQAKIERSLVLTCLPGTMLSQADVFILSFKDITTTFVWLGACSWSLDIIAFPTWTKAWWWPCLLLALVICDSQNVPLYFAQ